MKAIENETRRPTWTDDQRIILARKHLSGVAKDRWSSNYQEIKDWVTFKQQFQEVFGLNRLERERYMLQYAPQRKAGEPLKAYLERIYHTLNNFHPSSLMPEEDKLCQLRRILTGLLPSELLTPLFQEIPFRDMVRQIELHAQLFSWTNLFSEKIGTENKTKITTATTSLVKPTVAAAIPEGHKDQGNEKVQKPDVNANTVQKQTVQSTAVNPCQLCSHGAHPTSQSQRHKTPHKNQWAHPYKNPQGRQNYHQNRHQQCGGPYYNRKASRDQSINRCCRCGRKGHTLKNCWSKTCHLPQHPSIWRLRLWEHHKSSLRAIRLSRWGSCRTL